MQINQMAEQLVTMMRTDHRGQTLSAGAPQWEHCWARSQAHAGKCSGGSLSRLHCRWAVRSEGVADCESPRLRGGCLTDSLGGHPLRGPGLQEAQARLRDSPPPPPQYTNLMHQASSLNIKQFKYKYFHCLKGFLNYRFYTYQVVASRHSGVPRLLQ